MNRENRYLVVKRKDILEHLSASEERQLGLLVEKICEGRKQQGKKDLECVVVESDWPEYDETWMAIAARVDAEHGIKPEISRADQFTRYIKPS